MPWRRCHHAVANTQGSDAAHRIVSDATPTTMPAFTRPSPRPRASRGPRRTSRTSTTSSVRVAPSQSRSSRRSYRAARCTSSRPKTTFSSRCGTRRPSGTLVRHRSAATTNQRATPAAMVAPLTMRVAVISDVHANRHALEAVLEAVEAEEPDVVWCLGDTVGYGPQPNECCDLVRERADVCLVGNHDLVSLGELTVSDFNDDAAAAALWTADVLTDTSRLFLAALAPAARTDGVDLYHASARDPVWEYILTEEAARATFELARESLILVGHSHVALALRQDENGIAGGLAPGGAEVSLDGR